MFNANKVFDVFTGSGGFVFKVSKKSAFLMNNPFTQFVILLKQ